MGSASTCSCVFCDGEPCSHVAHHRFGCSFTIWDWSVLPHYTRHYRSDFPVLAKWMVSDVLMDPALVEIGFSALGFARGDKSKANAGEVHLRFMMLGDGQ